VLMDGLAGDDGLVDGFINGWIGWWMGGPSGDALLDR
jgi:hypothetical protein